MYLQEITRQHRTAFVIVLDRSMSMQEPIRFGQQIISKAEALSYTVNSLITELIDRCRRIDALHNYYDIAVVGYGNDQVEMLLDERGFIPVDELVIEHKDAVIAGHGVGVNSAVQGGGIYGA